AWAFVTMFALFGVLKVCGILRVSEADELAGLDVSEHGMTAYPLEMPGRMSIPGMAVASTQVPTAPQPGATAPAVVAAVKSDSDK
ncbi:MAG: hypothetical protein AB8B55_23805, partial [Mariniblastus sp.]